MFIIVILQYLLHVIMCLTSLHFMEVLNKINLFIHSFIKHAFTEQMIQYCLINLRNKDKDASDIINCIQQHI